MPTYDYHCDGCGRDFEVKQRISEAPLTTCDVCGGSVRRLLSAAPFILKGEGWYVTDYPSASRKKAMESEKGSDKSAATPEKTGAATSATSSEGTSKTAEGASKTASEAPAPSAASSPPSSD